MYEVQRSVDLQSLLDDPPVWDSLSQGVPMREAIWIGNWWRVYGDGREAYVITARDSEGSLRGLLPLYRMRTHREGRLLRAMGDGTTCTDYFSVLARAADAEAVAAAMGRWLARISRDRRDGWDRIEFDGLVGGDRAATALVDTLRGEGAATHASSRMNVWRRAIDDDWESHLVRLNSHDRRKSRRHRRSLEEGGDVVCRVAATKAELRVAVDVLIELHQRRWTEAGQTGSYATPASRDFLHLVAQELFDRDQLQLTWVETDGRPIGSEMRIIGRDQVMYCYSTGMDWTYAKLEPGRVLHIEGLLYAYQNGLRGIDYLRGDEEYKQRMLAVPRPLIQLRVIAPAWLPRLRHAAWLTSFEAKQFLRHRTGRKPLRTLDLV